MLIRSRTLGSLLAVSGVFLVIAIGAAVAGVLAPDGAFADSQVGVVAVSQQQFQRAPDTHLSRSQEHPQQYPGDGAQQMAGDRAGADQQPIGKHASPSAQRDGKLRSG